MESCFSRLLTWAEIAADSVEFETQAEIDATNDLLSECREFLSKEKPAQYKLNKIIDIFESGTNVELVDYLAQLWRERE